MLGQVARERSCRRPGRGSRPRGRCVASADAPTHPPTHPGTTIHWHGLYLLNASWADGVDGVTQGPIPPGATFRYAFTAGPPGTHWYHAHAGTQYADGLRGAFIVDPAKGAGRRAATDTFGGERVLLLADTAGVPSADVLSMLQSGGAPSMLPGTGTPALGGSTAAHGRRLASGETSVKMLDPSKASGPVVVERVAIANDMAPDQQQPHRGPAAAHGGGAAAAHGGAPSPVAAHAAAAPAPAPAPGATPALPDPQGGCAHQTTQDLSDAPYYGTLVNGQGYAADAASGALGGTPHVVNVTKGKSYRLRVINGASSWGYNVSIDSHSVQIVGVDGYATAPLRTRGVVLTAGEIADLKLTADQRVANYWIRVCTLSGYCGPAVLHYEGAPDPATDPALGAPPVAVGCQAATVQGVVDLKNTTALRGAPRSEGGEGPPPPTATKTVAMWLTLNSGDPSPPSNLTIQGYGPRPLPPPGCPAVTVNSASSPSSYCWGINWVIFEPPADGALPVYGAEYGKDGLLRRVGGEEVKGVASAPAPAPSGATSRRLAQAHGMSGMAAPAAPGPSAAVPPPLNAALRAAIANYALDVPARRAIDVVFINPGAMVHGMHVHGMGGWVLASGNGAPPLKSDGSVDSTKVNLRDPPFRSTVPVPNAAPGLGNGYTVWRLDPQRSGVWAMHCHIDYHAAAGMVMYWTVKEEGTPLGWKAPPQDLACVNASREAGEAKDGPTFAPF